jgi:outer membrane immunogenic protein
MAVLTMNSGSASAEDENTGASKWTGFYAGVSAGYTWSQPTTDRTAGYNTYGNTVGVVGNPAYASAAATLATTNALPVYTDGFIGGAQAGYNRAIDPKFVAGLEADFHLIATGDTSTTTISKIGPAGFAGFPIGQTLTFNAKLNNLGTVRGRLGYTITPDLLIYGTGGLAYGQASASTIITQRISGAPAITNSYGGSGSASEWLVGWTVGGGFEWWFSPKWTAKAEYYYYDLGSLDYKLNPLESYFNNGVPFTKAAATASAAFNGSVVHAGVNFHF